MGYRKYKEKLARVSGWQCHYCRRPLMCLDGLGDCSDLKTHNDFPQIDHIVPSRDGGANTLTNFVLCCRQCNRAKGTKSYQSFIEEMSAKREKG